MSLVCWDHLFFTRSFTGDGQPCSHSVFELYRKGLVSSRRPLIDFSLGLFFLAVKHRDHRHRHRRDGGVGITGLAGLLIATDDMYRPIDTHTHMRHELQSLNDNDERERE